MDHETEIDLRNGPLPGDAFVRYGAFGSPLRVHCRLRGPVALAALGRVAADLLALQPRPDAIVIDLGEADLALDTPGAAAALRMIRALAATGPLVVVAGATPDLRRLSTPADEPFLHFVPAEEPRSATRSA